MTLIGSEVAVESDSGDVKPKISFRVSSSGCFLESADLLLCGQNFYGTWSHNKQLELVELTVEESV